MKRDWEHVTVGDIATLQRGFDIPVDERGRGGMVPVISSGGISAWHNEAKVEGQGVLVGRKGTLGSVHWIDGQYWPNSTCLWVKDFHGNEPRFVYYFFKARAAEMLSMDVGAANPTLNRNHVHPLPAIRPPKNEQRAIAQMLGALDDKIELNRRMNATLEAMAQAVFKEWFVDGAKEEWEQKTIGDLADVVGGSTPSTKEESYWTDGIHCWATPKDLSSLTVPVLLDTERHLSDAGLAEVGSGLLPIGTVLMSSRAPIGYIAIAEVLTAVNQGFIAMKAKPGISNLFLWQWVKAAKDEIASRANGSTFQEISKANFRPIVVKSPPPEIMASFDKIVRPMYERIVANERETLTLAALRDTLLPKLMRGEVRVKDARTAQLKLQD